MRVILNFFIRLFKKCPGCINQIGWVDYRAYCKKCVIELLSRGKVGRYYGRN